MGKKYALGLQGQIVTLVFAVVFISLALSTTVTTFLVRKYIEEGIAEKLFTVAHYVTNQQDIQAAMLVTEPWKIIQPRVKEIIKAFGVDIVVVINMQGIRYAHVNEALLGGAITGGDEGPVLVGKTYVSKAKGISGPTLRVYTPMYNSQGQQIGAVSAGELMTNVTPKVTQAVVILFTVMTVTLGIGAIGAIFLAKKIKRAIFGLEPKEIAAVLQERNAMLDSIREGVVAVDRQGRVRVINQAAKHILSLGVALDSDIVGQPLNNVIRLTRLPEVVETGEAELDDEMRIGNTAILTNRVPVKVNGEIIGALATFRDLTQLQQLAEELTGIRQYTEALRAQAHEFANKLHTIAGLIELEAYQETYDYIAEITDYKQQTAHRVLTCCHDHLIAGLLIGKISRGKELGVRVETLENYLTELPKHVSQSLVTILGNLIQNSLEAVQDLPSDRRVVAVGIFERDKSISVQVRDKGPGISPEYLRRIFERNFTTKADHFGTGLYLVKHHTEELNGSVEVRNLEPGVEFTVTIPRGDQVDG